MLVTIGLLSVVSFVPPRPIRELRGLTRYRRKLVQATSAERNRPLKLLQSAIIKLSSVASEVFGCPAGAMLEALVVGKQTPAEMAQLARWWMRRKQNELEGELHGRLEEHHHFLLGVQMRHIETMEADVAELDKRLRVKLAPYRLAWT